MGKIKHDVINLQFTIINNMHLLTIIKNNKHAW